MNCKIIIDLLPLYYDDVVSEESRELVDDHLKTCEECRKVLEGFQETAKTNNTLRIEGPLLNSFKAAKKRLHHKSVVKIAVSILCTVAVVSALTYGVFFHEMTVPYSEVTRNIDRQINSPLDFITNISGYKSVSILSRGDSLFISFSNTFWTRYIARPDGQLQLNIPSPPEPAPPPRAPAVPGLDIPIPDAPEAPEAPEAPDLLTILSEATRVYYFEGSINEFSRHSPDMSKAILMWEKP